ncbi:hypothetical protein EAS62_20245 [Bradyrhizobium zhanjiangense]|uniref:Uncharacterized protein n=1 Tax=Bradyrhizobium zhanjiangense TaxID=1325107 RepID=A0ABY0DID1_9BRAD|nr:hypothetical protein EAS62_20245 [Bradyrhizobium zhanjiangense]
MSPRHATVTARLGGVVFIRQPALRLRRDIQRIGRRGRGDQVVVFGFRFLARPYEPRRSGPSIMPWAAPNFAG